MTRSGTPRTKALLLAGGVGSRLRPITDTLPKCLVPIAGRPILDYWVDALLEAGITDALINTHHHREQVVDYIRRTNAERGIHLVETYEPELLGSAGTIANNRDWMQDAGHCVIIYADNLSTIDLRDICRFHESHGDAFTMMLFRTSKPKQCGIAELDDEQRVISFVEKPEEPKSDLANAGLYVVTAEAYREMAEADGFDIGFDLLPGFVGRMRGWEFDGYHRDIGNHDALEQACADAPGLFSRSST